MRDSFIRHTGLFLVLLMSIGFVVSTLHSHHDLNWHQQQEPVDIAHCISEDDTTCPISGYLFEMDILSAQESGSTFFDVEKALQTYDYHTLRRDEVVVRGRAPPSVV